MYGERAVWRAFWPETLVDPTTQLCDEARPRHARESSPPVDG